MEKLDTQTSALRVLFIGNSYTHSHAMPAILQKLAAESGDRLEYALRAPGGWSLEQHFKDRETRAAIKQGGWDVIVLQDQSQRPAMPIERVRRQFFRYVRRLDWFIWWHLLPKPRLLLYMTWGRKDGDADNREYYPPVGTFDGMTTLLRQRYRHIAKKIEAAVCPVGDAWACVRLHYPAIELYDEDGHHPSLAGSYLAACCFYAALLQKNPQHLSYDHGLPPKTALCLRRAAARMTGFEAKEDRNSKPHDRHDSKQ